MPKQQNIRFKFESALMYFYSQWCGDTVTSNLFVNLIEKFQSYEFFNETLYQFKQFINSNDGIHPNRFKRTHLFLDAYCVSETSEFKNLNRIIDNYLQKDLKKNNSFANNFLKISINLINQAAGYFKSGMNFAIKNPFKSILLLLSMSSYQNPLNPKNISFKAIRAGRLYPGNHTFINDAIDSYQSINPSLLQFNNTLTIYTTSSHFFSELICKNCDNGNFYFDRHSILGPIIGTLRDSYEYSAQYNLQFRSVELSDKQANSALMTIKMLNNKINNNEIEYSIFGFNCIEYTQAIYHASGQSNDIVTFLGSEKLSGNAGALAYLKYTPLSTSSILKAIQIAERSYNQNQKQNVKDNVLNDVYCVENMGQFSFLTQFKCKTSPSGFQIPINHQSNFIPDAEFINTKLYFHKK